MFYSKSILDKLETIQPLKIQDDLFANIGKVATIKTYNHRHDIAMILPNGQTVFAVVILSDEPWVNLIAPQKIFNGEHVPQAIWFAEFDGQVITKIDSVKTPLFKYLAAGLVKPATKQVSPNFFVKFIPGDGTSIKISNDVFQNSGFSYDPVTSYLIEPEALLNENTGFGYYQFDPKLPNIDDGYWWMIHMLNTLNEKNNHYRALWDRYQQYLTR